MKTKPMNTKVYLASTLAAALLGISSVQAQVIKIDGSSTVYPITEAVAEDFQKAKKNSIQVTVGISGSGGGFKKLCRNEIDISNASRPILKAEIEACKTAGVSYYELPIAFDAITVVVHPKSFLKEITVAELKALWEPANQGKKTHWKDINPAWSDAPVKLFGPGADSGTFDYFTEAIVGKAKSSRGDYTASEDDNVLVQGISRDINGLGYFGYAYYAENMSKLKALPILANHAKAAVAPSEKTVIDGSYQPLSRPIFIYINAKSLDKPEVKEFINFYMKEVATLAKEVKYVPLSENAYKTNLDHLAKKRVGTVFGGVPEVGITIESLQKREAQ